MQIETKDQRDTVTSWEGRCLEPDEQCPTECDKDMVAMTETCYTCNIPPTCEGQLSSHSLYEHNTRYYITLSLSFYLFQCCIS